MKLPITAALALLLPTQDARIVFDVASVKPAAVPAEMIGPGGSIMITAPKGSSVSMPRNTGGPGSDDPARIRYPVISLKSLLSRAYDSYFDIVGPTWLGTQFVQVDATMPVETTNEQFHEMLRNLITDRFKLSFHMEPKEVSGYVLTIARGGSKMKEPASPPKEQEVKITAWEPQRTRLVGQQAAVSELVKYLQLFLKPDPAPGTPTVVVKDATGLTATYDFCLDFSSAPESDLPNLFSALQSQLGLKLDTKKIGVEVMVIDHMEKTPAAN